MAPPWSSSIFALRPSVCFRESLWNPTIGIVRQPKKGLYLHIRGFVSWGAQQIHQKIRQRTKDTIQKKMFLTVRSCICVSVRRLKKSQPKYRSVVAYRKTHHFLIIFDFEKSHLRVQFEFRDAQK